MSESQNEPKNSNESTPSRSAAERAVTKSNLSLAEQRRSGRTLGFLGLSTVGHVAILVALASVPMAIHEMNSGDNKPAGGGEVSMVDVSGDSAVIAANAMTSAKNNSTVEVSVMTDESSDVAMSKPEIKPEIKPVPKVEAAVVPLPEKKTIEKKQPVAKAAKLPEKSRPVSQPVKEVAVSAPVITEEAQEAPPVLLANPPSDDAQEAEVVKEEKPEPKAVAVVPPIKKEEPVAQPQEEPAQEVVDETPAPIAEKKSTPVAAAKASDPDSASNENNEETPAAATASSGHDEDAAPAKAASTIAQKSNGDGAGQGGQGEGGTAGAVAGPIRDASELKALSGNPNPVYPARDRLAHKEGTAVILGRVSPDGRVVETTLEKSSGSANMDAASIQAFRGWRFQAGQQGWVRKPFQFRLVGDAKEVPAPLGQGLKR